MKYLLLLALALTLFSCKTPQSIQSTSETFRFVERQVRDTILPGFSVQTELSLPKFLERRIYDTLKIVDPNTKGELLLWKNKYGELEAECNSQDRTITKLQESIREQHSMEATTLIHADTRSWWQKLIAWVPWYIFLLIGFMTGLVLRVRLF